ncbi:response regulator transcription factor [Raoultibacter phocaeensis]|uniref:response regulator transcription factor n=1 Tax=Raoultibacter phocaeensis TaxID=2479841 RepID=UPI00111B6F35|nr:response regulator transcription factor [Raoultibacter phocaeensis]
MRILLVEDDAAIVAALSNLLASEGYEVESASRQDVAVNLLESSSYDLALLDVSLEQGSGFAVCAAAREKAPAMPVVFLTASDDEYSTVAGLDMGAVDYIAKPFRARELLARINAALRRTQGAMQVLVLGDVEIDPVSATVRKGGDEVFLSALEYRLVLLFAQNAGSLVTRERLRNALWDSAGEYVSDNAINVYIKRLRERIEDDPSNPKIIVTVRGLGYKVGS